MSLSSQVGELESEVEVLRNRVEELEAIPHPMAGGAWFSHNEQGDMGIKVLLKDWDDGHLFLSLSRLIRDEAEDITRNLTDSEDWADMVANALERGAAKIRDAAKIPLAAAPDDIPEDAWEAANDAFDDWRGPGKVSLISAGSIARAILAERERCEAEWATKLMHAEAKAILSERERCHREFRQQAMAGLVHSPRAFAFRSEAPPLTPTPPIERE